MFPCQGGVQEATRAAEKLCQDLPSDPFGCFGGATSDFGVLVCFGVSGLRCCLNLINFHYVQPQKLLRQEKMAATDAAIKTQAGVGWRAGQVWRRCRAHCKAMGSLQRHH